MSKMNRNSSGQRITTSPRAVAADTPQLDRASALFSQALAHREQRELSAAKPVLEHALRLFRRHAGSAHPDVGHCLLVRARLALDEGRNQAAVRDARRALEILYRPSRLQLKREPDLVRLQLRALGCLGEARLAQGRYKEAASAHQKALRRGQRCLGLTDEDVATVLNNLAIVHKYTGRFRQARRLYLRALRITTSQYGEVHSAVATLYHNLGGLEHARGRFALAEPYARKSVKLRQLLLAPSHPEVAADQAALAAILDELGQLDEAEALYRQAIAVFERTYGPAHYELCINYNNLAALQHLRGSLDEAERTYRHALAMKEQLLGPSHPDVAMTLHNLAVLMADNGRAADAVELYERALTLFAQHLGQAHPKFLCCQQSYQDLLAAHCSTHEPRSAEKQPGQED